MVPVTGQRRHAQLLPESHQEVQVHQQIKKPFYGLILYWVEVSVSHISSLSIRPAVSATVRWPALTPLKRKGNSCLCVCVFGLRSKSKFKLPITDLWKQANTGITFCVDMVSLWAKSCIFTHSANPEATFIWRSVIGHLTTVRSIFKLLVRLNQEPKVCAK